MEPNQNKQDQLKISKLERYKNMVNFKSIKTNIKHWISTIFFFN